MSRLARVPLHLPKGVSFNLDGSQILIKGPLGELTTSCHETIKIENINNELAFSIVKNEDNAKAMLGTMRALIQNMVKGCSLGFMKKMKLEGVGYRAKATGKTLELTLGYSHPISFVVPAGITIETPEQTEIVVKGVDKHLVGQVAANIRKFRAPEPYKGKGIRYSDEIIIKKEVKKK